MNKSDLYVNWLASGLFTLDACFWGHDRGLFNDLVDFEFSPDTSLDVAREIVSSFLHIIGCVRVSPLNLRRCIGSGKQV